MSVKVISVDDLPLKRKLTAVLLADVVGYSRLMNIDEEGTHAELSSHFKDRIEPKIAEYDGHLLRTMGDGLLAEFNSSVAAVRCALDIQQIMANHNAGIDINRRIQLRIGINTGDVIVDDRDIYGNSVNIAARLEGLAEPGKIYVTQSVYDQMRGYPNLAFEDKGSHYVKNIDRPIRIFSVRYGHKDNTLSVKFNARIRLFSRAFRERRRSVLSRLIPLSQVGQYVV
jgi:adenylate cyclase